MSEEWIKKKANIETERKDEPRAVADDGTRRRLSDAKKYEKTKK